VGHPKLPKAEREIVLGQPSRSIDQPSARRAKLQPWLDFANLPGESDDALREAFIERFYRASDAPVVLSGGLATALRYTKSRRDELRRAYETIREILGRVPDFRRPDSASFGFALWYLADPGSADLTRFHFAPQPVLGSFLAAAEGSEIRRFQECPACSHLFYALRAAGEGADKNAGTKTCSKRCNETRRKRKLRMNQGKYQRHRQITRTRSRVSEKRP
jgi:hypothetical protein